MKNFFECLGICSNRLQNVWWSILKETAEISDYLYLTTNADFLKIQVFTDPREGNNYFFLELPWLTLLEKLLWARVLGSTSSKHL